MGTTNVAFDQGKQLAQQRLMQKNQYAEEQRIAGRNAQAQQLEAAIQNPSNDPFDPKLQPSADDAPDVASQKAAEIAKRQTYREQLFNQHAALYAPHESPTLFARLGGLISGKVKPSPATQAGGSGAPAATAAAPNQPTQPVSSAAPQAPPTIDAAGASDGSAPAPIQPPVVHDSLGIPISDPTVAAAHQQPMHPMATSHPILDRFNEGLDALSQHLHAAAHPVAPTDNSQLLAQTYQSPETTKRQDISQAAANAQRLQELKGGNQITIAEIRTQGIRGIPNNSAAVTADFARQLSENQGNRFVDVTTGKDIDLDQLPPDAKLVPVMQGQRTLGYQVATQKGHTTTIGNEVTPMGEFGQVREGNGAPLGPAKVATAKSGTSTDIYGQQHTNSSTSTPQTTGPTQPVSSLAPQSPNVIPGAPDLAAINAGIQANKGKAGAPSRKVAAAAPTQPVSSAAPPPAGQPRQLGANGQIPAGVANPRVIEAAQQLIDDRDVDKIPTAVRESAAGLARQYGWEQGKFTPREEMQVNVAAQKLNQLATSPALSVLGSFVSSAKIGKLIDPKTGPVEAAAIKQTLTPLESQFIREYQAALGTIQGLSAVTRQGRATEAMVGRLKQELPSVLQSTGPADGRARIQQLLQEIDVAKQKGSLGVMRGGKSQAAPQSLTDRLNDALGK